MEEREHATQLKPCGVKGRLKRLKGFPYGDRRKLNFGR